MNDDKKLYSKYIAKNSKELLRRGIAPDYEGTEHIEFLYLPVEEIERGFNSGRPEDIDLDNVESIAKMIQDGDWKPEYHEPPMVSIKNGKFVLEAGHHRWNGYSYARKKFILVSLVRFKDERSREAALLQENTKEKFVKKYASVDNIVSSLSKILDMDAEDPKVEITEKHIKKLITSTGNVSKLQKKLFNEIYDKLVKGAKIQTNIKKYGSGEAKEKAKKIHDQRPDSKSEDSRVQLFIGGETKAQRRLLEQALELKIKSKDPSRKVVVYCHYNLDKESEIIKNRKMESERVRKGEDKYVEYAKIINDKRYTSPELVFFGQVKGVDNFEEVRSE